MDRERRTRRVEAADLRLAILDAMVDDREPLFVITKSLSEFDFDTIAREVSAMWLEGLVRAYWLDEDREFREAMPQELSEGIDLVRRWIADPGSVRTPEFGLWFEPTGDGLALWKESPAVSTPSPNDLWRIDENLALGVVSVFAKEEAVALRVLAEWRDERREAIDIMSEPVVFRGATFPVRDVIIEDGVRVEARFRPPTEAGDATHRD
jgi:hypothetical protein